MLEKQLELSGFFGWQETEMIESENGSSVVFYYKTEKQEKDFILKIIINQYIETKQKNILISKIVHSIEEVYKIVDAIKNLVDVLNKQIN